MFLKGFLGKVISSAVLDRLIDVFRIKVDLTEPLEAFSSTSKIFRIKGFPSDCEVYIVDSDAGREIACHPSIVGDQLSQLCLEIASDAAQAILQFTPLREYAGDSIVFEHVLRAAPGYRLHEALKDVGISFREVWVRPRYVTPSYRDHDEETAKRLVIVYEDFSKLPENQDLIVIKPDTEASGRTGEIALRRLAKFVEEKGSRLEELIIYGFISEPGLKAIYEVAKKVGFKKIYAFAIGNLTALCYNMYDMPLYGPDESYYAECGEIKKLGGIIDYAALEKYAAEFIPGADQPGDWSARQVKVFTGTGYEPGGIPKHLKNSIEFIEKLWKISKDRDWFMEFHEVAIKRELQALRNELKKWI
ncbi:MAG: hypothetical protein DRN49_03555 [Thaumarchaeota archaeon]|nr:MAG: hypothetical protein DRN49_03555 [Nitrososphaerota archaeon]